MQGPRVNEPAPPRYQDLSPEDAIPRLLDEHGGKLFGLALRLCGSPEDAEELVQDIFLIAFRKWDQFEGRSDPTTWLYTIAPRACLRKHRKRAGEPEKIQFLEELVPQEVGTVPAFSSDAESPYEQFARREIQERVEEALYGVPQDFRMALILKDIAERYSSRNSMPLTELPPAPEFLSDRCRAFFRTLDLTLEACHRIGAGQIPPEVRGRVQEALGAHL